MSLLSSVRSLSPYSLANRSGVNITQILAFGCTGKPMSNDEHSRLQQAVDAHKSGAVHLQPSTDRSYATLDEVRKMLTTLGAEGAQSLLRMRRDTYASYFRDDDLSYSKLLRVKAAYLDALNSATIDSHARPLSVEANNQLVKTRVALVKMGEIIARLTAELDAHIGSPAVD